MLAVLVGVGPWDKRGGERGGEKKKESTWIQCKSEFLLDTALEWRSDKYMADRSPSAEQIVASHEMPPPPYSADDCTVVVGVHAEEVHDPHNPHDPQQVHDPHDPQQVHDPHDPQQAHYLHDPQQAHYPHDPQQAHYPHDPQQAHYPHDPQQAHYPQDPQQVHDPHDPQQAHYLQQAPSSLSMPERKHRDSRRGKPTKRWKPDEEQMLKVLVEECGEKNWIEISDRLSQSIGTSRSSMSCEQHWCAPPSQLRYMSSRACAALSPAADRTPLACLGTFACRQIMNGKRKTHVMIKQQQLALQAGVAVAAEPVDMGGSSIAGGTDGAVVVLGEHAVAAVGAASAAIKGAVEPEATEPERKRSRAGVKTPRWETAEESRLLALREELGERAWPSIALQLGTGRTASGVEQHWQIMEQRRKADENARAAAAIGSDVAEPDAASALALAAASGVIDDAATGNVDLAAMTAMATAHEGAGGEPTAVAHTVRPFGAAL